MTPAPSSYIALGMIFLTQGRIYRDAARRLNRMSRKLPRFDPVPYSLLCQSLELYLKGFIGVAEGIRQDNAAEAVRP